MRIKICRKEAKESRYWLQLIEAGDGTNLEKTKGFLIQEATELTNIFGAILRKANNLEKIRLSKSETNSDDKQKQISNKIRFRFTVVEFV